jgi:trans-aconitate methyltransferase
MDKTKIAVDIFNKLASSYQNKFMDVSMYHNSFDIFCDSIQKQSPDVLELACGPGNITQYLLKKRPDLNILGTDLAPNMIELAKLNNPNAMFEIMDSRAITKLNKTYDALMCGFILPYLSQEETIQLIRDSAKVLNANGVIYLSTMEDDYNKSGFRKGSTGDEIYMHYHQAAFLTNTLLANNFRIIDLHRKVYPGPNDEEVVDLILIANKK